MTFRTLLNDRLNQEVRNHLQHLNDADPGAVCVVDALENAHRSVSICNTAHKLGSETLQQAAEAILKEAHELLDLSFAVCNGN